jgi:hypothetical protein
MLQITWLLLGLLVLGGALRAGRSLRAFRLAVAALAALFLGAGAAVNAAYLALGRSYSHFADASSFEFVRSTWASLVVPREDLFITLLVVFEATVGVLLLVGGRSRRLALISVMAFLVALLAFSWWYLLWTVPLVLACRLLLLADRQWAELADRVELIPARSP